MRENMVQDTKPKNKTPHQEERSKSLKGMRFVEEFEKFYSNILQCKNAKKIKIKWIR